MVSWEDQRDHNLEGGIFDALFGRPGADQPSSSSARYTTSTGVVRRSSRLQVHLASAFARGVQRSVDYLKAQPWTADFSTSAARDSFPFFWVPRYGFFFLIGAGVSGVSWAGFWVFLRVVFCRPPPPSAGAGLGNLSVQSWPRTRF